MKKRFVALIILFSTASIFLGFRVVGLWQKKSQAGLVVTTPGQTHTVLLNNKPVGQTPFSSKTVSAGETNLSIGDYSTQITLTSGTETVVRRTQASVEAFSFGDTVWLEKTAGPAMLSVLSDPEEAGVVVNGEVAGTTPLVVSDISPGTHTVQVKKEGYRPSIVDLRISPSYRTYLSSDLMLLPVDVDLTQDSPKRLSTVKAVSTNFFKVYDFSSNNSLLYSDTSSWVKGVLFFIDLFEVDLDDFSYFVDYRGIIYNSKGKEISLDNVSESDQESVAVAYLGQGSSGEEISEEGKSALLALRQAVSPTQKKALVLSTGIGWLRVRQEPSLNSVEVTKVTVGSKYLYLEETESWVKIQLEDGNTGWVYADYVDIIEE